MSARRHSLLHAAMAAVLAASFSGAENSAPEKVSGGRIEFTRPVTIRHAFVNRGYIKVTDTVVRFTAPYTELGTYESDPSDNHFTDWTVGPGGTVTAGTGDRFFVAGNFTNGSAQNLTWNTGKSDLLFEGFAQHAFALAGSDIGPTYFGYVRNFAWKTMRLKAGESLSLGDGNAAPGAALYVGGLILEGGVAQISLLTGNGYNIYYDPLDPASSYLGVRTYPMTGGGVVTPVTASVEFLSTVLQPGGAERLHVIGVPGRFHTVKASGDLMNWTTIGTVLAGENGTFIFDDLAAGIIGRRFYRVEFP